MLECLKKCLDDFHVHNIEIIINLLDTCGKYLSKLDEVHLKFHHLLDYLQRLKESKFVFTSAEENISGKLLANLESAIQTSRGVTMLRQPPRKQELLTPVQLYVRHLLLERLNKVAIDRVAELLARVPWHEEEEFISRCFLQLVTAQSKFSEVLSFLLKF